VVAAALALAAPAAADAPTAEVTMPGKLYAPAQLQVLVGTTVTWKNSDSSTHTVTADNDSFDSGYLAPGATFAHTFDRPGVYAFHCTIHRFMKGVIRAYALVLNGPTAPVAAGRTVVLTGLAPAQGPVVLERRRGNGRWQPVERRRTRSDGSYAFSLPASVPGAFRARFGRRSTTSSAGSRRPA